MRQRGVISVAAVVAAVLCAQRFVSSQALLTNFTFTSAGASGQDGPSYLAALASYGNSAGWITDRTAYDVVNGVQYVTASLSGSYSFTVAGAASDGGKGAVLVRLFHARFFPLG